MALFQNFLGLSIAIKNHTQFVTTPKSRQHYVCTTTRCELASNKVLSKSHTYKPTTWSRDFIMGLETNDIQMKYKEKVNELEEKVRMMMIDYDGTGMRTLELLEFIDNIQRLGLGYRFHDNIRGLLKKINENNSVGHEENIYAASLKFRLLRQHGYSVSSQDFLKIYKEKNGELNIGSLETMDVKALLSLYEASYLAVEGEIDLHKAKLIATEQLLKINNGHEEDNVNIQRALETPLYRRMVKLDARWYIDAYGKRKDANKLLLELAILDFNMVQSTNKIDLQQVSKWSENLGLTRKLSSTRDRVVEIFYVSAVCAYEPQYSLCRIGLAKVGILLTIIDDIYDEYGPYESLYQFEIFTNAVKSWDINAMKYMPEYLQITFLALYNTINEMGYDTLIAQGKNVIPIISKAWGDLLEAFFVEAKRSKNNYMPTFEEYLDTALVSITQIVFLVHGYFLTNPDLSKLDANESLEYLGDLFKWSSVVSRLYNDLATSPHEMQRGQKINAITCYMNEHEVCEEVAREYVKAQIEKGWMKMMEARLALCSKEFIDKTFLVDMPINLCRFTLGLYQYCDGLGAPDANAMERVSSLIFEPIRIGE